MRVGSRIVLFYIYQMNRVHSRNDSHEHSVINVLLIISTQIIINIRPIIIIIGWLVLQHVLQSLVVSLLLLRHHYGNMQRWQWRPSAA